MVDAEVSKTSGVIPRAGSSPAPGIAVGTTTSGVRGSLPRAPEAVLDTSGHVGRTTASKWSGAWIEPLRTGDCISCGLVPGPAGPRGGGLLGPQPFSDSPRGLPILLLGLAPFSSQEVRRDELEVPGTRVRQGETSGSGSGQEGLNELPGYVLPQACRLSNGLPRTTVGTSAPMYLHNGQFLARWACTSTTDSSWLAGPFRSSGSTRWRGSRPCRRSPRTPGWPAWTWAP